LAAAIGIALTCSGCVKKILLNGQISSTREASPAINTLQDYEGARSVGQAGLGQLEGMHRLAPDNEDALFLLTRGWASVAFGFIEDEYEQAYEREDEPLSEYHLARARAAYQRAVHYGVQLLERTAQGFDAAKRNQETIRAWLVQNFDDPAQAEDLLWIGYAWIGHASAAREEPAIVAELFIGIEIVKRALELDETVAYGTGHVVLGAYHARSAMAELDQAKQHFERAIALSQGRYLVAKLNYAQRYYCAKGDRAGYERTLNEVLAAGDPLPAARLQNVIAKRRARRYLSNSVWQEECGFAMDASAGPARKDAGQ
jgi:tetratricopeptide (TPR) repeat protein